MNLYLDIDLKNIFFNELYHYVNANKIIVPDSTATKYANSVNSVHYFVQLPYGLNDPAVKKELVGNAEIDGEKYLSYLKSPISHFGLFQTWVSLGFNF